MEIEGVLHMCTERATSMQDERCPILSERRFVTFSSLKRQIIVILPSPACFLRCIHLHTAIKVATCPKTTRVGNTVPDGFAGIETGIEFVSSVHRSKAGGER